VIVVVPGASGVFNEDGGLFPSIQRGLMSSPHRGVIGTLEERIYTLKQFVPNNTRGPQELRRWNPKQP